MSENPGPADPGGHTHDHPHEHDHDHPHDGDHAHDADQTQPPVDTGPGPDEADVNHGRREGGRHVAD
ncbi:MULTISPECIES: hypothetical protein [Cellulomonas]|jgi:hypothetical protein|uniref:hypothetical protein n=1 Tax=Cellulomonas TaxID=1707 RepID=UPI00069A6308|nr:MULTISPECIES: hypothetical protein [Cellulomonas]